MTDLYDLKSHTSILTKGMLARAWYSTRCYLKLDASKMFGVQAVTRSATIDARIIIRSSHDPFSL
jgi:hypothetical protein